MDTILKKDDGFAAAEVDRRMSYGLRNALRTPAKRHEPSKVKGKESQSK
jgi:hypothetical protein